MLLPGVVGVVFAVAVVAGFLQHPVGDEILAGTVGVHDGLNQVLRHVLVVGQQLLGVLGQAVAAVAEGRIVVVGADAGIQTYAVNDLPGVQPFDFRVSVQLVEEADPQGQIGVGEQLDRFRFREAHEQRVDVFLLRAFLKQRGEGVGRLQQPGVVHVRAHDDAAGVQVVVQRLALPQKFRAEKKVPAAQLFPDGLGIADGNGGFDDHDRVRVDAHDQLDNAFHSGGVEIVFAAVIVGGHGDDHEIRLPVGRCAVQRGGQLKRTVRQKIFDFIILNGGAPLVEHLHLFGHDVHCSHGMMLREKRGNGKPYVAGSGYGNFQFGEWFHRLSSRRRRIRRTCISIL